MELQKVKIRKLFGQFDYAIALNQKDGITILTGPNGYGKTTILNIIYHFFKQNFFFFQRLNFESITFYFSNNRNISIKKRIKKETIKTLQTINWQKHVVPLEQSFIEVCLDLEVEGKIFEDYYIFNAEAENMFLQNISILYPVMQRMQRISQNILLDFNTGEQLDLEDLILQIPQKILEITNGFPKNNEQITLLISILSSVDVHLIKEQRRLKLSNIFERLNNNNNIINKPSFTIQSCAIELGNLIQQKQAEAFQESQKLDNSFPSRLIQNQKKLSPDEYNARFLTLTEKQQQLKQFGIAISDIQGPEYNDEKADVLSVYLEDTEKKMNFFDELVKKINLFVAIINEKKFAHKKINIGSNFGFNFTTDDEQILNLSALSSGEQEEVVVLYELLFKSQPNSFILIDEPEISLHVSWQKTFVNDILSILGIQPRSFLIATHSPQIINGRWDMVTDLYKLINREELSESE